MIIAITANNRAHYVVYYTLQVIDRVPHHKKTVTNKQDTKNC